MCLIIKKGQRCKYAKEDIVCYKVVRRFDKFDKTHYETPYRNCYVEFNITYDESTDGMVIKKGSDDIIINCDSELYRAVYGGAFHSFKKYSDAVNEATDWGMFNDIAAVVVKCIIPKGAKYYEGEVNLYSGIIGGFPEGYASDKIIYTNTIYDKWSDEDSPRWIEVIN